MVKLLWILGGISLLALMILLITRSYYKKDDPARPLQNITQIRQRVKVAIWIVVILLILIAILIPVGFYVDQLGAKTFSEKKDDWGTFGDFFGGVLNPIIALLTLVFTIIIALTLQANDRRKDVQPELVTDLTRVFYCDSFDSNGAPYPSMFSYIDFKKLPADTPRRYIPFSIPIYNIGNRTAKHVKFNFTMDFNLALSVLRSLNADNEHEGELKLITNSPNKNIYGKLDFDLGVRKDSILLIKDNQQSVSHIVNVDASNQPYHLSLPSDFLDLYQLYFFLYYWQKKESRKELKFPPISLAISYLDIYGNTYTTSFVINLEYWMGYDNTIHELSVTTG